MLFLDLFGFDSIKLCLSVRCLFLHLSKPLNFTFTFLSFTSFLCGELCFFGISAFLELDYFLFKGLFASACLILSCDSCFVANFSLLLESLYAFFFSDQILKLGFLCLLDVFKHLEPLFFEQFLLAQAFNLTFFDLVNNLRAA
jgi:hypothetical protein